MTCAWSELISILPLWMRDAVDRQGRERLTELRLRLDGPPELVLSGESQWLIRRVTAEDLSFCINASCRYSPWTAGSEAQGYLTAPGGHRIGICGEVVLKNGRVSSYQKVTSVCIRVARDFAGLWQERRNPPGSFLILGAPGWGKTTLLRDCTRQIAQEHYVAVVDERKELFPPGFQRGKRMDVLSGCPKVLGVETVLRTMAPEYIAVDEITAAQDAQTLLQAVGCGVSLAATAHAASYAEFCRRPIYQALAEYGLFQTVIQLHRDKTYRLERICQ